MSICCPLSVQAVSNLIFTLVRKGMMLAVGRSIPAAVAARAAGVPSSRTRGSSVITIRRSFVRGSRVSNDKNRPPGNNMTSIVGSSKIVVVCSLQKCAFSLCFCVPACYIQKSAPALSVGGTCLLPALLTVVEFVYVPPLQNPALTAGLSLIY